MADVANLDAKLESYFKLTFTIAKVSNFLIIFHNGIGG
jgi:hypothetical protein